jgi:hypothetical protein
MRLLYAGVTLILLVHLACPNAPFVSAAAAAPLTHCVVSGPAEQFAPTLADFGKAGSPYVSKANPEYWGGNGFQFGFVRDDYDAVLSNPGGGYLNGGVVLDEDDLGAQKTLRNSANDWTSDWKGEWNATSPTVGDEIVIIERLTTWEIAPQQPMTEVFVGFRYCNASVHLVFNTMPSLSPTEQGIRYARAIQERMASNAARQATRCTLSGPAQRYAPVETDLAPSGTDVKKADPTYWNNTGYLFELVHPAVEASPATAPDYLGGGIVLANTTQQASNDMKSARSSWTESWTTFDTLTESAIGDETVVTRRFTSSDDGEPTGSEVFMSFRYCNASVHFLVTGPDGVDTEAAAMRLAQGIQGRMQN